MEIRKGDKIKIRKDLVIGKQYDGITWLQSLQNKCEGKKFIGNVVGVSEELGTVIVTFGVSVLQWYITKEMIECRVENKRERIGDLFDDFG